MASAHTNLPDDPGALTNRARFLLISPPGNNPTGRPPGPPPSPAFLECPCVFRVTANVYAICAAEPGRWLPPMVFNGLSRCARRSVIFTTPGAYRRGWKTSEDRRRRNLCPDRRRHFCYERVRISRFQITIDMTSATPKTKQS